MRTVDIRALVESQQVQIWSKSLQRWVSGEVVQKADRDLGGIIVLVRYGDPAREKWLDAFLVAKFVRVATRPQRPAMADAGPTGKAAAAKVAAEKAAAEKAAP